MQIWTYRIAHRRRVCNAILFLGISPQWRYPFPWQIQTAPISASAPCARGPSWVALAQALSYLKLMELPNGGSLTPAMFPICVLCRALGAWARACWPALPFGLLQLIFDGAYAWGWQSMLLVLPGGLYPPGPGGSVSWGRPGASSRAPL